MDSLVGYGSDDDVESDRFGGQSVGGGGWRRNDARRRDDDTNYEEVNMDLSEDSEAESEPELPPAEPEPRRRSRDEHRTSDDNRSRESDRESDRSHGRRDRRDSTPHRHDRRDSPPHRHDRRDSTPHRHDRRDSPPHRHDRRDPSPHKHDRDRDRERDRRDSRKDDKYRSERAERGRYEGSSRRGLMGDRPEDRASDTKVPALMDLKPFGGEVPPGLGKSSDARDAVSPRFVDRDRRDRDKERERDRDRHTRRSEERRSDHRQRRSRSRGAPYPPPASHSSTSSERRGSPSGDYRPSSYKVNKKLEVMEKMGLQIKTPDGSMATAQQLRAAASEVPATCSALPTYCNAGAVRGTNILQQVQKRKLLWSNKNKSEAEEAAKWSGTRFAQDNDGKQVSKFMRLMGIKEPAALKTEPANEDADPIKKQEELFQAMQAQYEVARATTHTMRGVGLGFQRGQY